MLTHVPFSLKNNTRRLWISGVLLWLVAFCASPVTAAEPAKLDATVLIVGGGLTGLSTAYELNKAGIELAENTCVSIGELAGGKTGGKRGHSGLPGGFLKEPAP